MLNNKCIITLTLLATHTTIAFQVPLTPTTIKASTNFLRRKGVTCTGTQQRDIMTLSSCSIVENSKSLTLKAVEGDFDPGMISRDVSKGFLLNFVVYYAVKDAIGAPFSLSLKVSFIANFAYGLKSLETVSLYNTSMPAQYFDLF